EEGQGELAAMYRRQASVNVASGVLPMRSASAEFICHHCMMTISGLIWEKSSPRRLAARPMARLTTSPCSGDRSNSTSAMKSSSISILRYPVRAIQLEPQLQQAVWQLQQGCQRPGYIKAAFSDEAPRRDGGRADRGRRRRACIPTLVAVEAMAAEHLSLATDLP